MSSSLTAEQRSFRSSTRKFLSRTVPLSIHRDRPAGTPAFDRDWWERGAELGWTAMLVPEKFGGGTVSGAATSDLAVIAHEMGRICAPGALTTTSAVLTGLVRAGAAFVEPIEQILTGRRIAAWAHDEPGRGMNEDGAGVAADREPNGNLRLTGTKDRVESGDQTDDLLVSAISEAGPVQALVRADAPGVTVEPIWTVDLVRHAARVSFDAVVVAPEDVLHIGADAAAAIRAQMDVAAVLTAAEMCGAAERVLEVTLEWLEGRYSFGRPLSSYQALKHRMADDHTWLEGCLAVTSGAARALDEQSSDAAQLVAAAKSYVGARAPGILQDAVQLHGGIGVTWEHDLHLFLRRVTLGRALYGTPEEHRRRLARLLIESDPPRSS